MKRIAPIVVLLVAVATTSASAQALSVRLVIKQESWLGNPPIDLRQEIADKLKKSNIEITDGDDAPEVIFEYSEVAVPGSPPYLVPATDISFKIGVRVTGGGFMMSKNLTTRSPRPLPNYASAVELREQVLQTMRVDPTYVAIGDIVGAHLGSETSMRALMLREDDISFLRSTAARPREIFCKR